MTSKAPKRGALVACEPCGARFESVTLEMASYKFRAHVCAPRASEEPASEPAEVLEVQPERESDAALAADYLDRLRRVERVLAAGLHNPAHFIARIRAAIGVLPDA